MGQALNMEKSFAETIYNRSDGFVVQSRHFVDYWRERGVKTPIYVVGRPINPDTWSRQPQGDPFPAHFKVGKRLVCVCRHDREKNLRRLIKIFCNNIAPYDDEATLTLVGDGHDHKNLAQACMATPYADRIHLPGESTHEQLVDWYAHADVFVYTSLSETFGNVVNEALWCGLPVVALDDGMGVAGQVVHDVNGALIPPHVIDADGRFGAACLQILGDRQQRRAMGSEAANLSRATSHPDVVLSRFEGIYREAREHCRRTVPVPLERQGKVASWKAFAKAYATWAFWNGTLLTVAHTATRLGASRTGGAVQHGEVEQLVRDLEQRIEREQRTAA
jgi:glycosyltransferase involved in cell wall biosynthesis